ncbi:ABC transporter permease [Micromonospora zingiberis]|uniref:ABC transporter permease n=1 Tax=Micromonospora zingiberis TaxID=2053011 RepID=A0A4R0GLW3_9ACTN|nr:ABC transporter permease [Micromonospora zingiberis]TCB98356.1 ABC transporter permease [Micromonospora zingiberis]
MSTAVVDATARVPLVSAADPLRLRLLGWPTSRALAAVVVLFAVSAVLSGASVSRTALLAMLPFAALTAIVAAGQTLVVQQAGLDLSVAGGISFGALMVAKYGGPGQLGIGLAVTLALAAALAAGLVSGLVITAFGLPPLVVTIAVNAILIGLVQFLSGGYSAQAPEALTGFAVGRTLGVPNLVLVAAAVIGLAQLVLKCTVLGRRFELVGANRRAAHAAGLHTRRYTIAAYALSALLAGGTGVLLAGFLSTTTLTAGDAYLLPSVAAVVLGGTALTGGRGSLTGTALGALFLGQLNQLVQTYTQTTAVQNIVQAVIIGVGIVVQLSIATRLRRQAIRRNPT